MSKPEEKITDAELEVMQALWEAKGPMTLAQVKAALAGHNKDTTKTLLRRLCEKGAVGQEKREVYYYCPLVERDELGLYRTGRLIEKLYAGSAKAMVASLVEHEQLGPQDVEELRELFANLTGKAERKAPFETTSDDLPVNGDRRALHH